MNRKCDYCFSRQKVKAYIIADDMEKTRYLCQRCKELLDFEVLKRLAGDKI